MHVDLLHIADYRQHESCLQKVEKDLQCFGVYPQILRTAHMDKDMRKHSYQSTHDRYETQLDIIYYGLSVHQ